MSDRPEMKQAPGSRDSESPWVPPHSEPQQHDNPKIQAPDVQHDLGPDTPGVLGGAPSTGWDTEDE
jgi:hypothetical protein